MASQEDAFILTREVIKRGPIVGIYWGPVTAIEGKTPNQNHLFSISKDDGDHYTKPVVNILSSAGVKMVKTRKAAKHEEVLIKQIENYFRPITGKRYAEQLIKFLLSLDREAYSDMLEHLGRSKKREREAMRRTLFICSQFSQWQNQDGYEEPAKHCRVHGIDLTAAALQKYMNRSLGLYLSGDSASDIFK